MILHRTLSMSMLLVCFAADAAVKKPFNEITKIFFHQGPLGGKLTFYCSQTPVCNLMPGKAITEDRQRAIFYMPWTKFTAGKPGEEVRQMSRAIMADKTNNAHYTIRIEETATPLPGINVVVLYNPRTVECSCDHYSAIKGEHAIEFNLYNKEILTTINTKTDGVMRVAIDSGHGGTDDGAIGCCGIKEKDITLNVGKKLAQRLKKDGYEVVVTRNSDKFVSLDRRTALANNRHADLFISIHANSGKPHNEGLETFWLNPELLKPCMDTIPKSLIVAYYEQQRGMRSKQCAEIFQQELLAIVRKEIPLVDRHVKSAVSQVLLGTAMPAILVELGFVSNQQEAIRLASNDYQELLVNGMASAVKGYFQQVCVA